MLTPDPSASTQIFYLLTLLIIWFLLTFAGERRLVLPQKNTGRRKKGSYLQRDTSMATDDVHHHNQGHL